VVDLNMTSKYRLDALGRFYKLLTGIRPTILHTWMYHPNITGRLLGRATHVPVIITSRHNTVIGSAWREKINRWTSQFDDKVIAVCEIARQLEIDHTGVQTGKVLTIKYGIDPDRFVRLSPEERLQKRQQLGIPRDSFVIVSIGRLHIQKGFSFLIKAIDEARQTIPNIRQLIVGGGVLQAQLMAEVQKLRLSSQIIFTGERLDIPEILGACDLFVSASLWEGLPNTLLEAMAMELPIVATNVGGTPEVVMDNITGLLIPPANSHAISEAIQYLFQNPDVRKNMGEAGRNRVFQHFTIYQMVQQTKNLYYRLLEEKKLVT
jgi:glycosyltransferase involved in cell wall biosynthesis